MLSQHDPTVFISVQFNYNYTTKRLKIDEIIVVDPLCKHGGVWMN